LWIFILVLKSIDKLKQYEKIQDAKREVGGSVADPDPDPDPAQS